MKSRLTLLILLFSCGNLFAQTNVQRQIREVENGLRPDADVIFTDSVHQYHLDERMALYHVPSVSIAVIHEGKVAWAKTYGYANVAAKRKADTHTLYQAASLSKSVNAFAIVKLSQEGKLDLDKDIRDYLKTWTFPDNDFSRGKTITLKNLLSHTAGLGSRGFMGYAKNTPLPDINQVLNGAPPANNEGVKPVMPPGTQSQYSGGGIVITQKILLDNITTDYAALMHTEVLKPLGMTQSTFRQPLPQSYSNIAAGHDAAGRMIPGGYNVYPEQAPDGLWSTPTDLAKFVLAIQASLKGKGPLSKDRVTEMLTPVLPGSNAALGTFITEHGGEKYFFHTGANIGYRSVYYGSFTTGNGVVVMLNADDDRLLDEIVNSVAVAYHWKDFYHPEERKLVSVPDSFLDRYAGKYHSEQPKLDVVVRKMNGGLELATRGKFERLYFTRDTVFFLRSDLHSTGYFIPDAVHNGYGLEVRQGEKRLFIARKQ